MYLSIMNNACPTYSIKSKYLSKAALERIFRLALVKLFDQIYF